MYGARFVRGVLLAVSMLAAAAAPARAQEYVLGAPDVLKITVWGQEDLSKEYVMPVLGIIPSYSEKGS